MENQVMKQEKKQGLVALLAGKFNLEPTKFYSVIKNTVMPNSATPEDVAAFLMVSKEYGLNPILREIHAFPKKGGGIQTVVGIDGWAKLICGNKDFDGMEFGYEEHPSGKKPLSVTCTLYRKSCSRPTVVTEYYEECFRNTEPWKGMPRRMLRHKALMQCGRIAFGISGIMDEDEANDIREVDSTVLEDEPSEKAQAVLDEIEKRKVKPPKETPEAESEPDKQEAVEEEEPEKEIVRENYKALCSLYDTYEQEIDDLLTEYNLAELPFHDKVEPEAVAEHEVMMGDVLEKIRAKIESEK